MKTRLILLLLTPILLISCMSYHDMSIEYQSELQNGNIDKAYKLINGNKFLKKKRNTMLKFLEKGKLAHLNGLYKESNTYFNSVDSILDLNLKNIGGAILGTLTNPEATPYKAEDFEKVTIHYYKALNYYYLGQFDDALVEAKRVNLKLHEINDKYPPNRKNRYTSDAFALTLQGLLYEASGDINNAFISYRNAVDLYLKSENHTYFGVTLPPSLSKDVLRTAYLLGFTNEFEFYKRELKMNYNPPKPNKGGELVLIWEKGLVPFKDQTYYTFHMVPQDGVNVLDVYNSELGISIPIPVDADKKNGNYEVFNVAFAKYISRPAYYTSANIQVNSRSYSFEEIEDYEHIAFKTLEDRRLREVTNAATRLAAKKIAEYVARDQDDNLGTALSIFNALMEKADTRNWQTLPESLNYVRIPLKLGNNTIKVTYTSVNGKTLENEFEVIGNGQLQIRNDYTF